MPSKSTPSRYSIGGVPQHGFYDIRLPGCVVGPAHFEAAWNYLNGIRTGYIAAQGQETV